MEKDKAVSINLIKVIVFNFEKLEDCKDGIYMKMDYVLVDDVVRIIFKLVYIHYNDLVYHVYEGKLGTMNNIVEQSIYN